MVHPFFPIQSVPFRLGDMGRPVPSVKPLQTVCDTFRQTSTGRRWMCMCVCIYSMWKTKCRHKKNCAVHAGKNTCKSSKPSGPPHGRTFTSQSSPSVEKKKVTCRYATKEIFRFFFFFFLLTFIKRLYNSRWRGGQMYNTCICICYIWKREKENIHFAELG